MGIEAKAAGESSIEGSDYAEIAEVVNRIFADMSDGGSDPNSFSPGSSLICSQTLTGPISEGYQNTFSLIDGHGAKDGDLIIVYLDSEIINDERHVARPRRLHRYGIDFEDGTITIAAGDAPLGERGSVLRAYNRESHRFGWGGEPCAPLPEEHLPPGEDRRVLASYLNGLIGRAGIMEDMAGEFCGWSKWVNLGSDPSAGELNLGLISDFGHVMADGIGRFGTSQLQEPGSTPHGRSPSMGPRSEGVFAVWTEGESQHLIAAHGGAESGALSHQGRKRAKRADLGAETAMTAEAGGLVAVSHAGHGMAAGDMVEFSGLSVGTLSPAKTAQKSLIDLMDGGRFAVDSATRDFFTVIVDGAAEGTEIAEGGLAGGIAAVWTDWMWSAELPDGAFESGLDFSGTGRTHPRGILLGEGLQAPVIADGGPLWAIVADTPRTGTKDGQVALCATEEGLWGGGKIWIARRMIADMESAGADVSREEPILLEDFARARRTALAVQADPCQCRGALTEGAAESVRSSSWGGKDGTEWKIIAASFETEFESYSAARHFFNRGGEIVLSLKAGEGAPDSLGRLIAANRTRRIAGRSAPPFAPGSESGFYTLHGEPGAWTLVREFESADGLCRVTQKHESRSGKFVHSARVELGHPSETDAGVSVSVGHRVPAEARRGGLRLPGGAAPPASVSESFEKPQAAPAGASSATVGSSTSATITGSATGI